MDDIFPPISTTTGGCTKAWRSERHVMSFVSCSIGRLRGFLSTKAAVPADSCVYAIGDIHGQIDLLKALHRKILSDVKRRRAVRKVVIYIGDYVDRGEKSPHVLDLLLDQPLPDFEHVYLMGNHEQSLLEFLRNASIGPRWVRLGGNQSLYGYGVRPPWSTLAMDFELTRQQFAERLPLRHRRFLERLPYTHVEGDYFFVHAGVRPGVPLVAQVPDDLLWIRDDFLRSKVFHGKIIVHGHSITDQPDVCWNRIGIDTGAFASGKLTCLVLEGTRRAFLQT